MASVADRLFTELDRQLVEIRTTADGIATRAGFLISANALAAGLLGARIASIARSGWTTAAIVAFGLSALFGIAAIVPSMYIGLKGSRLTAWLHNGTGTAASQTKEIFAEKIVILERNHFLLHAIRVLYCVQVGVVLVAIFTALMAAATGQPAQPPGSGGP